MSRNFNICLTLCLVLVLFSCNKEESIQTLDTDATLTDEPEVTGVVDCNGNAGGDSVKVFFRNGSLIEAKKTNPGGRFSFSVPANTELTLEVKLLDASKDTVIDVTSGAAGSVVNMGKINLCNPYVFTQIASGFAHSLALRSDGSIWGWGNNNHGQLGDSTLSNHPVPIRIGTENDWIKIVAHGNFSMGLKYDGTLWAWGDNGRGQLGDGTQIDRYNPVQEITQSNNWSEVAAGYSHVIALKSNYTLWSWGNNYSGELGQGTSAITSQSIPTQVGTDQDWKYVYAGGVSEFMNVSCAIKSDDRLWFWGDNYWGQCNLGANNIYSPEPRNNQLDWKPQVSIGGSHVVALRLNGSLWSWGFNSYSQVGNNYNNTCYSPILINATTNWKSVTAGGLFSMALKSDGTLWSWGANTFGNLANGSYYQQGSPAQVTNDSDWMAISSAGNHVVLLKNNGSVWCVGSGSSGQLGNSLTSNSPSPVRVLF